jgi:class 3 adenylate cyclase
VGEFTLDGPVGTRAAAWRTVSDLDELARMGGLPPLTCGYVRTAEGFGALRGTLLGPAGIRHDFEEHDHGWERGRRVWQHRRIDGPLLRSAGFRGTVVPVDGGFVPRLHFTAEPNGVLAAPGVAGLMGGLRRQWRRLLRTSGPPTRRRLDAESRQALDRWRRRGVPEDLVARFQDWAELAPDADLRDLRPFALAAAWGLDPDETLGWLLEGTTAGLVELVFVVRCPGCAVATARLPRLGHVEERAECVACGRGFLIDLREHVEVRMVALPRLAPPEQERWATLLPRARPGVEALASVPAGASRTLQVELRGGRWRLDAGGALAPAQVEVAPGAGEHAAWTVGEGASLRVGPGVVSIDVHNPGLRPVRVGLVDEDAAHARLCAARLATFPTFRGVFGMQTLAPGVYLGVSRVALLVTDLVASQRLYETVGDRAALAYVDAHLREAERVITQGGGVRVKTVGDSLVAAFDAPGPAAAAALALQADYPRWAAAQGVAGVPGLRVGVACGPALAAHSDASGLDWCGGTANRAVTAARGAREGEVALTPTVAGVAAVPAGWAAEARGDLTVLSRA